MHTDDLTESERLELMRFLCSFAWADGVVQPQEKTVLERILGSLELSAEAHAEAEGWLTAAPSVQGRALRSIDEKKRATFIDGAYEVAAADGEIAADELEHLKMFMRFTYGEG